MRLSKLSIALLPLALMGCQSEPTQANAPAPALTIEVAQVAQTQVAQWQQFTTRLQAPQQVLLRPRVTGVIEEVVFEEGSDVKRGDLLVRLDARPFAAEVERLQAERRRAIAALNQSQSEARRSKQLLSSRAISTEEAESRQFLAQQRQAELASIDAALEAARLNLSYTDIRAPIDGRVSLAQVTAGNTVTSNQTVLTSLVSTERVYAYFDVDERRWNQMFAAEAAEHVLPVEAQLTGESDFSHLGQLDFIDNHVNAATGTMRVRATFNVDSRALRPGAFARVRMAPMQAQTQILVPDQAIGTELSNRFVLVVNADNVLEYRQVKLGQRVNGLRVVTEGLHAGERIAANGPARVQPGMTITPETVVLTLPKAAVAKQSATKSATKLEGNA